MKYGDIGPEIESKPFSVAILHSELIDVLVHGRRRPPIKGKIVRYVANRSSKELLLRTHNAVIGLIQEIVSKI